MKNSIKKLIENDQGELNELVTTNKCLAMEKRELHRQKLRTYSEKAVKLRAILRQTTDSEQKKCIETKLKTLQEKQDAEIVKLTKIDEIQKQIDHFITEENDQYEQKGRASKKSSIKYEIESTPAHRLRTKSSATYKRNYNDVAVELVFDRSKNKQDYDLKSSTEQLLLRDSREVLEELSINKLAQSTNVNDQFKKSCNRQDKNKYSYYKNEGNKSSSASKMKAIRSKYTDQNEQTVHFQDIPVAFQDLVSKVNQFWPDNCDDLVRYFRQSEDLKNKMAKREHQSAYLSKKEEKVREQEGKLKRAEEKVRKTESNLKYLIDKERQLMERIDKLEKQEKLINKKVQSSLMAISNSYEQVVRSSMKFRHKAQRNQNQMMKISFQSFDSFQDSSHLANQLSKFEQEVQEYVLAGEKEIMLMSGQLQQVNLKLSKSRDETAQIESKKTRVEQQLTKLDHAVSNRRGILKQLQSQILKMQEEAAEAGATSQLKKSIAQELEDKCQKLKMKKKSLSERIKKIEDDGQTLTERKHELYQTIIELEQKSVNMKTYEKQLETKIIFFERDKQNREKDIKMMEEKTQEAMQRVRQINNNYQSVMTQITQKKVQLAKISQQIQLKKNEEKVENEKLHSLQQQLAKLSSVLEQKNAEIQKQTNQIQQKTTQNQEIQNRLTQNKDKLTQLQEQIKLAAEKIEQQKEKAEIETKNVEELVGAKQELQEILHEVMMKKEELMAEIEQRSKQFGSLLENLESGQEDYANLSESLASFKAQIQQKKRQIKGLKFQWQEMRRDLDDQLEEQSNLTGRINRLKEVQRTILLGVGAKGGSNFLDEELKGRVSEVVGELGALGDLKTQLKEVKYENRKYRLQNQRLTKLLEG